MRAACLSIIVVASTWSIAAGAPTPAAPPIRRSQPDRSALVTGVISIGIPLVALPVVSLVDYEEFRARGSTRTAWDLVGWANIAAFVAAPTIGSFYAGVPWNTGTKIRLAGSVLVGGAIALVATEHRAEEITGRDLIAFGIVIGGLATYGVGWAAETVISIRATEHHDARPTVSTAHIGLVPIAGVRDVVPGVGCFGAF